MKSEHWTDVNEGKINSEEFFNELILTFPILKEQIFEESPEMVHYRMERFATYTIEQIKKKDWDELKKCFSFQESKIEVVNSELVNALTVSYCESLLLGELAYQMEKIIPLMGTRLQRLYKDYEKYYNDLVEKSKVIKLTRE